ncbi:MAG: lipocalin-like domain-containing protein [Pseudomonadota bacterium]
MKTARALLGTWSLVTWYNQTADGQKTYPLGRDAGGYISYTADGFVFVQVAASHRALYAVNNPLEGTTAEDSAAMKSLISYAGTYTVSGNHVIHRVTEASFPNWVGTEQVRTFDITGDRLRLSASGVVFQGQEVSSTVDWIRAQA